jgi:predicted lipid carrier protein YhbT
MMPPNAGLRRAVVLPFQAFSSLAMAIMLRRHPSVFERLADLDEPTFLIEPRELPLAFLMYADRARPRLEIVPKSTEVQATARIRGSLKTLIDLLEGRIDGDALFFSRELAVEGSIEAVVALRNAVDGEGFDVATDLLAVLGPLSGPGRAIVRASGAMLARARRLYHGAQDALMTPAMRRLEVQGEKLTALERRLAAVECRPAARRRARS